MPGHDTGAGFPRAILFLARHGVPPRARAHSAHERTKPHAGSRRALSCPRLVGAAASAGREAAADPLGGLAAGARRRRHAGAMVRALAGRQCRHRHRRDFQPDRARRRSRAWRRRLARASRTPARRAARDGDGADRRRRTALLFRASRRPGAEPRRPRAGRRSARRRRLCGCPALAASLRRALCLAERPRAAGDGARRFAALAPVRHARAARASRAPRGAAARARRRERGRAPINPRRADRG